MDSLSALPTVDEDKLPGDSCSSNSPECSVDHLSIRNGPRSMTLSIDSPCSSVGRTSLFIADETPTPTRFIRNCEEVGLFQDLQHVNPFDEQFRRAAEAVSQASPALSLSSDRVTDDVLHTPHVFPTPVEAEPVLPPPRTSTVRRAFLMPTLSTSECLHLPSPLPTPQPPTPLPPPPPPPPPLSQSSESSEELSNPPPPKKRGRKPNCRNDNSVKATTGTVSIKPRPSEPSSGSESTNSTLQLLFRLPDGRLVQVPAVPVPSESGSNTTAALSPAVAPVTPIPQTTVAPAASVDPGAKAANVNISEAKIKLKEVLSKSIGTKSSSSSPSALVLYNSGSSDNGTDNDLPTVSSADLNEPLRSTSTLGDHRRRLSTSDNDSEAEKRRKYLERNRAAAFRSRQKRKRWINSLEQRTNDLGKTNKALQTEVVSLRSEVAKLKAMLLAHKNCPVTLAMNKNGNRDDEISQTIIVPDILNNQLTPILSANNNNSLTSRQIILLNTGTPLLALPVVSKALDS